MLLVLLVALVWECSAFTHSQWPTPSTDPVVQRLTRLEVKMDRTLDKVNSLLDTPSASHRINKMEQQLNDIQQFLHDHLISKKPLEVEQMNEFVNKLNSLSKQVDDSRARIIRRLTKIQTMPEKTELTTSRSNTKRSVADSSSSLQENRQMDDFRTSYCKEISVKLGNMAYLLDHRLLYAINGVRKDIRQGNEIVRETRDLVGSLENRIASYSPEITTSPSLIEKPMPPPERMMPAPKMSDDEPSQILAQGLEMMGKGLLLMAKQRDDPSATEDPSRPKSCAELFKQGNTKSGVYSIWPTPPGKPAVHVLAYCDMDTSTGGWTVFQRRGLFGGKQENFSRPWTEYKKGFGQPTRDFWLGNDALHALTAQEPVRLRVELEAWDKDKGYAEYSQFVVSDEDDLYRITVGDYMGDIPDGLSYHNGSAFSTIDSNNADHKSRNCHTGEGQGGGWWYKNCYYSKLNSPYYFQGDVGRSEGIVWRVWKSFMYSLKATEMKVRPLCFSEEQKCSQDIM